MPVGSTNFRGDSNQIRPWGRSHGMGTFAGLSETEEEGPDRVRYRRSTHPVRVHRSMLHRSHCR